MPTAATAIAPAWRGDEKESADQRNQLGAVRQPEVNDRHRRYWGTRPQGDGVGKCYPGIRRRGDLRGVSNAITRPSSRPATRCAATTPRAVVGDDDNGLLQPGLDAAELRALARGDRIERDERFVIEQHAGSGRARAHARRADVPSGQLSGHRPAGAPRTTDELRSSRPAPRSRRRPSATPRTTPIVVGRSGAGKAHS